MNLFTPERQADETQAAYRQRRAQAKRAVKAMRCAGLGDQRKAPSQREQMRDTRRKSDAGLKGRYGADLIAHFADKNAAAQAAKAQRRSLR